MFLDEENTDGTMPTASDANAAEATTPVEGAEATPATEETPAA